MPRLLDEGMYFADGQIQDEVYVYGSFMQSKMYYAGVTCSDCHEPGVEDDFMMGRAQAFHAQCIGCHEDSGVTPGQSDCASCHENQLDGIPNTTHLDNCSNCHNTSTGALVTTLGTDTTTFSTGGNCQTCHTDTWLTTHNTSTPDHTSLVQVAATDCASCHDNTLASAAADTHLSDCSNCHNANGSQIGRASCRERV